MKGTHVENKMPYVRVATFTKNRRRIIRGLKETKTVKEKQKEGKLYGAGDF